MSFARFWLGRKNYRTRSLMHRMRYVWSCGSENTFPSLRCFLRFLRSHLEFFFKSTVIVECQILYIHRRIDLFGRLFIIFTIYLYHA